MAVRIEQLEQVLNHIQSTNVVDLNVYNYLVQVAREHWLTLKYSQATIEEASFRDPSMGLIGYDSTKQT